MRLCRIVRMSRVVAAREKMSAGELGFGGWVWLWLWECGRDGVDVEWRREVGDVRDEALEEEEVEVDIIEGVFFVRRAQKDEMRWRGVACGEVAVASVWVEDAAEETSEEDEEEEKAKEKREGEPERPMRMAVPFEEEEFGLVWFGDAARLSFSGGSVRRVGLCLRLVRPPEGRRVLAGWTGFRITGAVGRVQRSGAE